MRYKGREIDPKQVDQELGVRAVLTGRFMQRGDDLAISVDARRRQRRLAWKQIDRSLIEDRLKHIPTLYGTPIGDFREFTLDLEDVCVDLLEFVG